MTIKTCMNNPEQYLCMIFDSHRKVIVARWYGLYSVITDACSALSLTTCVRSCVRAFLRPFVRPVRSSVRRSNSMPGDGSDA